MKKIIWGIAIVFCLQIAFQLAMTGQRADADYASLKTPLQNGLAEPAASLDDDMLDTNIYTGDAAVSYARPYAPAAAKTRPVTARYERLRARPETTNTAAFKPVIITYNRPAVTPEAATFAGGAKAAPQRQPADKRSFLARVVTKPYDWLKAVGSRFR